jgi:hypothetical protein
MEWKEEASRREFYYVRGGEGPSASSTQNRYYQEPLPSQERYFLLF